jgi:hypothetical protein
LQGNERLITAVKSLVRHIAVRVPVVLIAAVAWLALSNHCALAGMERASKTPMHCHGGADTNHAPAKDDKQGGVECCKVLRATLLTSAKSVAALDEFLFAPYKYFVAIVVLPDTSHEIGASEWDTGPPGGGSFAESVLQRSILAHAPPFVA